MSARPKVIILVLSWNRKDLTLKCLASLEEQVYGNLRVAVIDNASSDGTEQAVRRTYPWAEIIQNGENLGYAGGNNQGIKWALAQKADYLFLINNDTKLEEHCVAALVETAEKNPDFGILGPVAFSYEDEKKALTTGFNLDWSLVRFFPFNLVHGDQILAQPEDVFRVDVVQGDAFFVRRNVFETIGFFDEKFFLLGEECDFCLRAKAAGFLAGIVKKTRFYRMLSPTIGTDSPLRSYYSTRNIMLLISKHVAKEKKKSISLHFMKKISWDLRGYYLPTGRVKNVLAYLHGLLDFFIHRFGRCRLYS